MSAWNFKLENSHVLTPIASVRPVKTTAAPVSLRAAAIASSK